MHFRPNNNNLNASERLTCARSRPYGSENVLKIGEHKLKKVDKVKFLGVIIDDKLNWESQIENIITKLTLSIVMIKRITKFIPKSEYMKIYDALFKSHISYCISSWGSIPDYKLQKIFAIQKRGVRLLFGKEYSFDHAGYYETCARVRTYEEHTTPKNYCLEHTKPIFNEYKVLNLSNIYVHQSFMELFKVLKNHTPVSIFNLFTLGTRDTNVLLQIPKRFLNISKNNFVSKSSVLWNSLISKILEKAQPCENGIIINGSARNSDLSTPIQFVKNKLRCILLSHQIFGDPLEWVPENFCGKYLTDS